MNYMNEYENLELVEGLLQPLLACSFCTIVVMLASLLFIKNYKS